MAPYSDPHPPTPGTAPCAVRTLRIGACGRRQLPGPDTAGRRSTRVPVRPLPVVVMIIMAIVFAAGAAPPIREEPAAWSPTSLGRGLVDGSPADHGAADGGAGVPAASAGAGIPAPGARYAWPLLPTPTVLIPFRAPAHAYGPGHRGVDLAGTAGQPVLAARAGTVVFAGMVAGRPLVSVQHDDGLRTTYEPVTPTVAGGAVVAAGAVLGVLEPGHRGCDGACLHWGVRRDRTDYLDPLVLLRPQRIRLLPVPDPWPA